MGKLRLEVLPHPPYSPDLAPSDYPLFGPMNKMLGGQKFASDTEVQSTAHQLDISQHRFLHQAFRNLLTDAMYLNEFERYTEK